MPTIEWDLRQPSLFGVNAYFLTLRYLFQASQFCSELSLIVKPLPCSPYRRRLFIVVYVYALRLHWINFQIASNNEQRPLSLLSFGVMILVKEQRSRLTLGFTDGVSIIIRGLSSIFILQKIMRQLNEDLQLIGTFYYGKSSIWFGGSALEGKPFVSKSSVSCLLVVQHHRYYAQPTSSEGWWMQETL
jgi:hypothetical protein